ncbi:hypothetical protein PIB30_113772, partial [Stylosanthes scabra]|nr:hypothetical protein [Stylosanthes scabra]
DRRNRQPTPLDPEIERTIRKLKKQTKILQHSTSQASNTSQDSTSEESEVVEDNIMAADGNNQRRTLGEYTIPSTASCGSSIVKPNIEANNFELKPSLIQL